ncbi:MAG: cupredoxin family protein [Gammaproteobacteria bacterium]|nr:cupredoxin family protein [Gammaproteobacteria bacterium]
MKNTVKTFYAALVVVMLGLTPVGVYAHSEEHANDVQYDPVENEFGSYQPGMEVTRTIEVVMNDQMRFSPDLIKVNKGDVIRFVHTNSGQLMHEFVLGTPEVLAQHAEMMKKFPGMEHSEPYMAHVPPGKKGQIIWKFSKSGEFSFGCLIPGHFDAGMKGRVIVGS